MAIENRLELRLLQKLILTPQLQQAIKLLQMPQLELSQTLSNELMENPLLEEEVAEEISPEEAANAEPPEHEAEPPDDTEAAIDQIMKFSVDDYFEERGSDGRDLGYFTPGRAALPEFEMGTGQEMSLQEHLLWQLRLSSASSPLKAAGEAVIGNIDENGYLRATPEEIAEAASSTAELAAEAIRLIQGFDPPGVGARDLSECLLIQLKGLGHGEESPCIGIVMNNLEDLEKKRYKKIAADYGLSLDDAMKAVRCIESLEPKPGRNFSSEAPIYIVPDVYVIKTGKSYEIILNDESIPRLRINAFYRGLLMQKNSMPKEERRYLEEKLRSAVWLLKSLDHRNKTIYRVTESILNFQSGFFEKGAPSLKPMNLKDVAADLQMHESTISRATSNKYMACNHGLFCFRYFFSSGVDSGEGKVSSTAVKEQIKKIISEEDGRKPLSDQKVAEILKGRDISIARRTIAKYRDELKIAPQMQRKKTE